MSWAVRFDKPARKQFERLSVDNRNRIANFLSRRLVGLDDPREIGEALSGRYRGYWKYRVGHYRVIAKIEDEELIILVIRLGHRREIYR